MKFNRSVFSFLVGLLCMGFPFLNLEAADLVIKCTDSDGGLNLPQEGEVTVTATHKDRVILQKSLRDTNWLKSKKYVEFYCDEAKQWPQYKIISCDDALEYQYLPSHACPSVAKGSIMLEARHASGQPKNITDSPQIFKPYYKLSVTATVEPVFLKTLRLNIAIRGFKKSSQVRFKITRESNTIPLGNTLIAWNQTEVQQATAIVRLDQPLEIEVGTPQILTVWLQGLEEILPYISNDNQIVVTIEDLELSSNYKLYFESKPQINRFEIQ